MKNVNVLKKINKVMLIDDDKATNFINKKLITRLGIANEIIVKENGREALHYLGNAKIFPSLIILDIYMPEMDAFEFIVEFKKLENYKNNKTRMVILTDSSDIDDLIRLKYLGKYIYWNKPLLEEKIMNLYSKYFKEEESE
jgi:CheY-like chemotaxis protein